MSSILLYGGTIPARKSIVDKTLEDLGMEQNENNPDLLIIEKEEKKRSIGIEKSREVTKFLYEKPFNHLRKVVVINNAELLTTQAQNALLKTLEEPPEFATIILNSKTEDALLETVISRCKRVRVKNTKKESSDSPSAKDVLNNSIGERLAWAAEYSKEDREVVIDTLEDWVSELRNDLKPNNAFNIELILKVKNDLENTNLTLKLALETLLIKAK